jgi:hypothetical protein
VGVTTPRRRRKPNEPPVKAANGRANVDDILASMDPETRSAFERDFEDATKSHPSETVRVALRRGGRRYAAAGWLLAYEAAVPIAESDGDDWRHERELVLGNQVRLENQLRLKTEALRQAMIVLSVYRTALQYGQGWSDSFQATFEVLQRAAAEADRAMAVPA